MVTYLREQQIFLLVEYEDVKKISYCPRSDYKLIRTIKRLTKYQVPNELDYSSKGGENRKALWQRSVRIHCGYGELKRASNRTLPLQLQDNMNL